MEALAARVLDIRSVAAYRPGRATANSGIGVKQDNRGDPAMAGCVHGVAKGRPPCFYCLLGAPARRAEG
eukprot:3984953-Alexandrium_andersonii.AAC.1